MKIVLIAYKPKGANRYEIDGEVEIEKYGWHLIKIKYKDVEFTVDTQKLYKALKLLI